MHCKTMSESKKNPAAVALGRLGGLKGGKARAKTLTAAARKRIAKRAAAARWKGKRKAHLTRPATTLSPKRRGKAKR